MCLVALGHPQAWAYITLIGVPGCTHLDAPLGYERPPPSKAPPLAPVRVAVRWPGKVNMPEVGPHPEGLKADTGETDPLPWKREVGQEKTGMNSSGRVRDGVTSGCYLSCLIS